MQWHSITNPMIDLSAAKVCIHQIYAPESLSIAINRYQSLSTTYSLINSFNPSLSQAFKLAECTLNMTQMFSCFLLSCSLKLPLQAYRETYDLYDISMLHHIFFGCHGFVLEALCRLCSWEAAWNWCSSGRLPLFLALHATRQNHSFDCWSHDVTRLPHWTHESFQLLMTNMSQKSLCLFSDPFPFFPSLSDLQLIVTRFCAVPICFTVCS